MREIRPYFLRTRQNNAVDGRLELEIRKQLALLQQRMRATGQRFGALKRVLPDGTHLHFIVNLNGANPVLLAKVSGENLVSPVIFDYYGGFVFTPSTLVSDYVSEQDYTWLTSFLATTLYFSQTSIWRTIKEKGLQFFQPTPKQGAVVNWFGIDVESGQEREVVLSWNHGLATRYRLYPSQDCSGRVTGFDVAGFPEIANSGLPGLYLWGRAYNTRWRHPDDDYLFNLNVVGAACFRRYVVFISHVDIEWRPTVGQTDADRLQSQAEANSTKVAIFYGPLGGPYIHAASHDWGYFCKAPWFFNPSCTKASSLKDITLSSQKRWDINITWTQVDEETWQPSFSFLESDLDTQAFGITTPVEEASAQDIETSYPAGWTFRNDWRTNETFQLYTTEVTKTNLCVPERPYVTYPEETTVVDGIGGVSERFAVRDKFCLWYDSLCRSCGGILNQDRWPGISESRFMEDYLDPQAWRDSETAYVVWSDPNLTISFQFWRNISRRMVSETKIDSIYTREVFGKKYVGFDFDSAGNDLIIDVTLSDEGDLAYISHLAPRTAWSMWRAVSYRTQYFHLYDEQGRGRTITGLMHYKLNVNGIPIVDVKGGIDGSYYRLRTHCSGVESSTDPIYPNGVDYVHNDITPAPIYSECCYVKDLDARTLSCIYELRRIDHTPYEPSDAGDISESDFFTPRYLGTTVVTDHMVTVIGGAVVSEQQTEVDSIEAGFDLRAMQAHFQLMPRFYDPLDQVDEQSFAASLFFNPGTGGYTATRYWKDGGGGLRTLLPGHLQSRGQEIMVSTYDYVLGRRLIDYVVQWRNAPAFVVLAKFPLISGDAVFDVAEYLSPQLLLPGGHPVGADAFHLTKIVAV